MADHLGVAKRADAVYVLHSFHKKGRKTNLKDIEQARKRYKQIGVQHMNKTSTESSGNVFTDLGFAPDEAAILKMRADLMADLRRLIEAKKLTQAQAAQMLGVSQSRVSDLVRGKWEKFSLEMLIALATRAGMRISLNRAA